MIARVRQDRRCVGEKCGFRKPGQGGCPCYEGLVRAAEARAEREAGEAAEMESVAEIMERNRKYGRKGARKIEAGQTTLF